MGGGGEGVAWPCYAVLFLSVGWKGRAYPLVTANRMDLMGIARPSCGLAKQQRNYACGPLRRCVGLGSFSQAGPCRCFRSAAEGSGPLRKPMAAGASRGAGIVCGKSGASVWNQYAIGSMRRAPDLMSRGRDDEVPAGDARLAFVGLL